MLVALLFDRAAVTMRNLAIAALIVVAFSPHEVVGPSFQMSFAATAALIAAYAAWSDRRLRSDRRAGWSRDRPLPRAVLDKAVAYAGGIAATSLIAGTATALYGIWHFHRAAPLGLVANLLAMPVVSLVVMPPAVLAGVLMPFGLDGPALDLMGWGIGIMMAIARWLAERTPFDAVGAIPASAVLMLTTALVLATVLTTWLRAIAIPLAAIGIAIIAARDLPDMFVSEDGRLVAMRMANGDLAVNRARPSDFVTGIWKGAAMAGAIVKPTVVANAATGNPRTPQVLASSLARTPPDSPFACESEVCIARHANGALVAFLSEGTSTAGYCGFVAVLVVDDATVGAVCPGDVRTTILTKRDLARGGSAEIVFAGAAEPPATRRAIAEPFRPWHAHRHFSRAARGLPPYRREDRDQPVADRPAEGETPTPPETSAAGQ